MNLGRASCAALIGGLTGPVVGASLHVAMVNMYLRWTGEMGAAFPLSIALGLAYLSALVVFGVPAAALSVVGVWRLMREQRRGVPAANLRRCGIMYGVAFGCAPVGAFAILSALRGSDPGMLSLILMMLPAGLAGASTVLMLTQFVVLRASVPIRKSS